MNGIVKFGEVSEKVVRLRDQDVLLDFSVAELYGVETKRVNEAVKNNPDKFPEGYIFELQQSEKQYVVENFDHLQGLKKSPVLPKAFTEKGLYMLATILKSERAAQTTIAIIEAFAKLRELSRTIGEMSANPRQIPTKDLDAEKRRNHGRPVRRGYADHRHGNRNRIELCRVEAETHRQTEKVIEKIRCIYRNDNETR